MVLGKLPVPGRPTNLNNNRARAYCASNRCERGTFLLSSSIFLFILSLSLSLSLSLWETEKLSERAVKFKTTNQPTSAETWLFQYLEFLR